MSGWLGFEVLLTAVVAWLGQRSIGGFDVRGPFLLMSPVYASSIFYSIFATYAQNREIPEREPKPTEVDLIETTARDFGLGSVEVNRQRIGNEWRLVVTPVGYKTCTVTDQWEKLDFDAKRFAIVWALVDARMPWPAKVRDFLAGHSGRVVAMLLAGCNLWLILACHSATAAIYACFWIWRRDKLMTKRDVRALSIMRNLMAAFRFVKSDSVNSVLDITPERRIIALKRAAARLGIA